MHALSTTHASARLSPSVLRPVVVLLLLADAAIHLALRPAHAGLLAEGFLAAATACAGLAAAIALGHPRLAYPATLALCLGLLISFAVVHAAPLPPSASDHPGVHPGHTHATEAAPSTGHAGHPVVVATASKTLELVTLGLVAVLMLQRRQGASTPARFRHRRSRAAVLVGLVAPLLLAVSCTSARGTAVMATPSATTAPAGVEIKLFVYSPASLNVPAGTTITWVNRDAIEHSVTHGTKEQPGGAFDSGLFVEGQTYTRTFGETGVFPYFCTRHPHMQGEVRVQNG